MGGDVSQKLLPWRGMHSSPGLSRTPAHYEINALSQTQSPASPCNAVVQIAGFSRQATVSKIGCLSTESRLPEKDR